MKKLLLLLLTLLLVFSCDVAGEIEDAADKVEDSVDQGSQTNYVDTWVTDPYTTKVPMLNISGTTTDVDADLVTELTLNDNSYESYTQITIKGEGSIVPVGTVMESYAKGTLEDLGDNTIKTTTTHKKQSKEEEYTELSETEPRTFTWLIIGDELRLNNNGNLRIYTKKKK